jgi:hypothetical protein
MNPNLNLPNETARSWTGLAVGILNTNQDADSHQTLANDFIDRVCAHQDPLPLNRVNDDWFRLATQLAASIRRLQQKSQGRTNGQASRG